MRSIGVFLPSVARYGVHCIPEDYIKIGYDLGAKNHLAIHWGTVRLGEDTVEETIRRFRVGAEKLNIPKKRIWIFKT
ncbi:hypothetical protein OAJ93_01110 [Gammaproteobacteria bacterium]|nr:hypothetical protein [Gammaproteobacteria bacterium]